jgi:hypothetical protein
MAGRRRMVIIQEFASPASTVAHNCTVLGTGNIHRHWRTVVGSEWGILPLVATVVLIRSLGGVTTGIGWGAGVGREGEIGEYQDSYSSSIKVGEILVEVVVVGKMVDTRGMFHHIFIIGKEYW